MAESLGIKKIDILNREPFIDQVIEVIGKISDGKKGATFAIDGEWGCGKTFVVDAISECIDYFSRYSENYELREDKERYVVFHYNCWKYDYYEEPLYAIITAITDEMKKHKGGNYSNYSAWSDAFKVFFEVITGLEIFSKYKDIKETDNSQPTISELQSFGESINALREELNKLSTAKELPHRDTIIVFVDELDRCLPEYSIKVLERLHHLFDDMNVIVVLSIDSRQLENTVRKIFGSIHVDEYLKKFIDFQMYLDAGESDSRNIRRKYDEYFFVLDVGVFFKLDTEWNIYFDGIKGRDIDKIFSKATTIHSLVYDDNERIPMCIVHAELIATIFSVIYVEKVVPFPTIIYQLYRFVSSNKGYIGKDVKYYDIFSRIADELRGEGLRVDEDNRGYVVRLHFTHKALNQAVYYLFKYFNNNHSDKSNSMCPLRNDENQETKNYNQKKIDKFISLLSVIE